jgi:hypothetical protein
MVDDARSVNRGDHETSPVDDRSGDITGVSGRQAAETSRSASQDELGVIVAGVSDLHEATHRALAEALANHGRALLNEASRLEAAANPGLAPPLITPTMIHDADTLRRIGYAQTGKANDRRNWMLGSLAATFVSGFFTNNLTEPWGAIGFVICGAIALVCFNKGSQT